MPDLRLTRGLGTPLTHFRVLEKFVNVNFRPGRSRYFLLSGPRTAPLGKSAVWTLM